MSTDLLIYTIVFLLLSIIVLVSTFLFYLLKQGERKNITSADDIKSIFKDLNNSLKNVNATSPEKKIQNTVLNCSINSNLRANGICSICDRPFSEIHLRMNGSIVFCKDHYDLFLTSKWIALKTIKTTPDTPKEAIPLYEIKKDKWNIQNIPSFIITDYKINFEGDTIESYVSLYVIEKDAELFKELHIH